MKESKKMFGYDILYIDDLRFDNVAVRRIWPEHDICFPGWFLTKLQDHDYKYQVVSPKSLDIECLELL